MGKDDGTAAAVCRSQFFNADDVSALLDVLEAVSSAGGGSDAGNITQASIEVFLKPSSTLEGAVKDEGSHLVKDGMRMEQWWQKDHLCVILWW